MFRVAMTEASGDECQGGGQVYRWLDLFLLAVLSLRQPLFDMISDVEKLTSMMRVSHTFLYHKFDLYG
jgi:hypothetical protein